MAKYQIKKALRQKKLTKEELFNAAYNVVNSIMNSQIQKEYIDHTAFLNGLTLEENA